MSMILYHSTLHCACRGPAEQNSDDPNVTIQIKSKLEKRMVILQSPLQLVQSMLKVFTRQKQNHRMVMSEAEGEN